MRKHDVRNSGVPEEAREKRRNTVSDFVEVEVNKQEVDLEEVGIESRRRTSWT